ncbi:MAG: FAD-dependent thymidylate synthase [Anaerolineales bacterium]
MPTRQIYLLSPRHLSAETIAVTFAKTSRSPQSFREIAAELSDEQSARFHEKWVIGYGHASVAEHAVLHLAFENVSRLAIECIESNRLASYTEKSTRYQTWGMDEFYIPPELDSSPLRQNYIETTRFLFRTYQEILPALRARIEERFPRREDETLEAWDRRVRSRYVDAARFLLPASALANLGMTVNARALEHAIRKMLSHPLEEVRQIGAQVKEVAQQEVPTLLKYAEASPYLQHLSQQIEAAAEREAAKMPAMERMVPLQQAHSPQLDWCILVSYDPDAETRILAAALYRYGDLSYPEALRAVRQATETQRRAWAEVLLKGVGRHQPPLREFEHTSYTFDLMMDQGAYFEFKRHRMMTQSPQLLTASLGYATPRLIEEAGVAEQYHRAMRKAAETYGELAAWNPQVAQYIVPNGFYRRVLAPFNLREAYHFCQLRAAGNAHFSMRRLALRIAEEIRRVHPLLASAMQLPAETWQAVDAESFV